MIYTCVMSGHEEDIQLPLSRGCGLTLQPSQKGAYQLSGMQCVGNYKVLECWSKTNCSIAGLLVSLRPNRSVGSVYPTQCPHFIAIPTTPAQAAVRTHTHTHIRIHLHVYMYTSTCIHVYLDTVVQAAYRIRWNVCSGLVFSYFRVSLHLQKENSKKYWYLVWERGKLRSRKIKKPRKFREIKSPRKFQRTQLQ